MLRLLLDSYRAVTDVDMFTLVVTAGLVISAYILIKACTGSLLLASLFVPFLAAGGLVAHYFFDIHFVNVLNDKDSNTVLSIACGVLAAMLIMTAVTKIFVVINEWHYGRARPKQFVASRLPAK